MKDTSMIAAVLSAMVGVMIVGFASITAKLDVIASKRPPQVTVTNIINTIENHPYVEPKLNPQYWMWTNNIPMYIGPTIMLNKASHMDTLLNKKEAE